jgi:hypothetical protein
MTPEEAQLELTAKYPILAYFKYTHLPEHLQEYSKPIHDVALLMVVQLPPGPETAAGLRKLLEAKDCFVRAAL